MRVKPVLALCTALGAWATLALPLLRVAPNRLMSGEPVYWATLMPAWAWWLWLPLMISMIRPARRAIRHGADEAATGSGSTLTDVLLVFTMSLCMAALLGLAGSQATHIAHTGSTLVRTSLGAGFWTLITLAWLVSLDTVKTLTRSDLLQTAWLMLVALPSMTLIGLGLCNDLSLLKEYTNRSDEFWEAVLRHLQIVAIATLPSVLIGLPLAWAGGRYAGWRKVMFPLLNIIQTIPSIALFGLFMAPLAWAAMRWPGLRNAGISGVGLAPAVLALVLYSLLPIVRSALAGLEQVPVAAKTAAQAMGMSGWQIFYWVEVPLALPVWLPGLRVAVVQTIGLTAVTALVGAGGLGALMFDGLFSAANDLVLLGVLPIVLMAVLADTVFKALMTWVDPATSAVQTPDMPVLKMMRAPVR